MRAARTPPEPPPITKRSQSKSAMTAAQARLEIMALFLHLGAEAIHPLLADLASPLLNIFERLIEHLRLDTRHLLAQRRLVEGEHVLQFLLGETVGIELRRIAHELVAARRKFGAQLGGNVVEVLGELRIGLQQRALGL